MSKFYLQVALALPLRQCFDYLAEAPVAIGARVKVPFGKHSKIGIVVAHGSDLQPDKLRSIEQVIDSEAILPPALLELLSWCAQYYQAPLGEQIFAALPLKIRQGQKTTQHELKWDIGPDCPQEPLDQLKRAPKQSVFLRQLLNAGGSLRQSEIASYHASKSAIKALLHKSWILESEIETSQIEPEGSNIHAQHLSLNSEQQHAYSAIVQDQHQFKCFLLKGITGSGKTEVYLQAIARILDAGRSALVLVPEIGLTPQTLQRFTQRFGVAIYSYHSGMSDVERMRSWLAAKNSQSGIFIGTRSAVFLPIMDLGIVIIDEEHDTSFKQQEGVRYHARDVAIKRAADLKIPIVLGSATPSLESLLNAQENRYHMLELNQRASGQAAPQIELIDLRRQGHSDLVSQPLYQAIQSNLERGEQTLLFLNRRGFAPVIMCDQCGWIGHCQRCDAKLTVHAQIQQWQCHHCGAAEKAAQTCPECQGPSLKSIGSGTEKIEATLTQLFPEQSIVRIDRDSTRKRGALTEKLKQAYEGTALLLVGTQMLAKGHHLPKLSLVGILNPDEGLFSADLRAAEHTAQLILQVAGRAGREQQAGRVLLQTYHPDHPLLLDIQQHRYDQFAYRTLEERKMAFWPPYSSLCLLRAEAHQIGAVKKFLLESKSVFAMLPTGIELLGPVPAGMERKAGKYRWQLLIQAPKRSQLNYFLKNWIPQFSNLSSSRQVRWSIDVDPISLL